MMKTKTDTTKYCAASSCSVPYEPVRLQVTETQLLNIYDILLDALEYMQDALAYHDAATGRTTRKNKSYAEMIEDDTRKVKASISCLQKEFPYTFTPNEKV